MKLLVIEDEELIVEFLRRSLKKEFHEVDIARDGERGLQKALRGAYDAIVLDILLPNKNGLEVCRQLRRSNVTTPVLFLTSKSSEQERLEGFAAGADDYITKPFSHKELNARLMAITRRPRIKFEPRVEFEDVVLNSNAREVTRGGVDICLRPKEFRLLEYMMQRPELALSKNELLHHVWGVDMFATSNRLEVAIRSLRMKLEEPFPDRKHFIRTVRGFGYKLTKKQF